MIEFCKFSKVKTCYSFCHITIRVQALRNLSDDGQVVGVFKAGDIFLPESLCVAWAPSELLSLNLIPQFVDRAENFRVLVKVGE